MCISTDELKRAKQKSLSNTQCLTKVFDKRESSLKNLVGSLSLFRQTSLENQLITIEGEVK